MAAVKLETLKQLLLKHYYKDCPSSPGQISLYKKTVII